MPEGASDFSVFQNIQTDPEFHLVLFPNGNKAVGQWRWPLTFI